MEEKKNKGYWIVDIERWEYIWMSEEPAPQFPHRLAIRKGVYFYLKGSLKNFPRKLFRVAKRLLTGQFRLARIPKPLVIIDEEAWTYYSDGETIPTWRYVKMFLFSKGHQDPFVKRCLEVARRCFRCSLKPSQLPLGSEKPIESK